MQKLVVERNVSLEEFSGETVNADPSGETLMITVWNKETLTLMAEYKDWVSYTWTEEVNEDQSVDQ